MLNSMVRFDALCSVLTLLSRSSLPELCESILRLVNPKPHLLCFNILIHWYCKAQDFKEVTQVRTTLQLSGLREDTVTYNALITYSGQAKDASLIWSLYNDMKMLRLPIDNRTLACLINAASLCSIDLNWFVNEIERLIGDDGPDVFVCEPIIRGFGNQGYFLIQSRWPGVFTGRCNDVLWARLIRHFDKACLDVPLTINILNALSPLHNSMQIPDDFHMRIIMQKLQSNQHTFSALIQALSRSGYSADRLMILFGRMIAFGCGPNPFIIPTMIHAPGKRYAIAQCRQVLDWARKERLPLTESIYTAMIRAYARLGDLDSSQLLLDEMRQRLPTIDTFNVLFATCIVKGDLPLAHGMLSLLTDLQLRPSLTTFHELLRLYAQAGYVEQSQDIMNHIHSECDFEPDRFAYGLYNKAKRHENRV